MHNLGQHILMKEAALSGGAPTPLIIEITYNSPDNSTVTAGLNYLKLGEVHYAIYERLKHLLSIDEQNELESLVAHRVKKSLNFINLCCAINDNRVHVNARYFINHLYECIPNLAILGYVLFETISEYTMLYSTDEVSASYAKIGEFNNTIYKAFLLDVYKNIGRFKLSDYRLTADEIESKLSSLQKERKTDIHADSLFDYIRDRVSFMVNTLFLTNPSDELSLLDVSWNYSGFANIFRPLVGHTIHRELRNFNRYKDFYFYFDQLKALSAWNYWNKMNISLPFNGPLQKGEIGINPAYQGASYRIYTGITMHDNTNYLKIGDYLKGIEIVPRLVDLRHTTMRSHDHTTTPVPMHESGTL